MKQEHRRFPRAPESFSVRYRITGELAGSWASAAVVNFSAGGIRFRHPEPIDVGAALALQMRMPGIAEVLSVRGQAVWSQLQASGVVESGVEFMDVTIPQQRLIDQLVGFLKTGFSWAC